MGTAVLAVRLALAGVFVLAGVAKLRDLEGSRQAVRDFGVPDRAASPVGLLLPLAELVAAVLLLVQPTARWGAVVALLLLLAFVAGIAAALRRGQTPDCHCFGQIHSAPAGPATLVRNAVLAALAVFVIAEGPGPSIVTWVGDRTPAEIAAVALGIAAVGFGVLALQLWRERGEMAAELRTAQRLAGSATPGIPIGSEAPDFSLSDLHGETVTLADLRERGRPMLLVFASPACHSCTELLPKLGQWQRSLGERLTIALISSGRAEDHAVWDEHGLEDVLLQDRLEVVEEFRIRGTPSAVIVTVDGTVASNPAESVFGIEPLIRLALRDGAGAQVVA